MTHVRQRRALITGGAGFIGSHLAEHLLVNNYHVTIIDDLSTGKFENIAHLTDNLSCRVVIDSIMNEIVFDRLASEADVIFHLAAAVGVMLIVDHPVQTIETNVMGTEAVLKAALRYRAKVLLASTSEVYGKGNRVPFSEEDDIVLGPTSRNRWAYAASKMVDEFLALAYAREKGLPVVIIRLFNTIGPRQTGQYGMVVPRLVTQAINHEPLTVFGDGKQTRCFLHVKDSVEAILSLDQEPNSIGQVINVGSTQETSINNIAELILQEAYKRGFIPSEKGLIQNIPYTEAYTPGFEDMKRRVPNITKLKSITGWNPSHSLTETISDVFDFLLEKTP